jgi:hypothetical protein
MITKDTILIVMKDFQTPYYNFKYGEKSTVSYFSEKLGKSVSQFMSDFMDALLDDWFQSEDDFVKNDKINKIIDIIVNETDIRGIDLSLYCTKFVDAANVLLNKINNSEKASEISNKILSLQRYEFNIEKDEEENIYAVSLPASYGDYIKYEDIVHLIEK